MPTMRDLFIKDWGWKLFSLFLAVTIWLTVHRILEPETASLAGLTSTLTYENLPVFIVSSTIDVSQYRVSPSVAKVTVSGPPEVMNRLQANQVRAVIDLTNSAASSGQVNVLAPPNVTLIRVEPQTAFIFPPPKH